MKATGSWGAYQVEGPGLYYNGVLMPFNDADVVHEDDVHTLYFTSWPQAAYTGDPKFVLLCLQFFPV